MFEQKLLEAPSAKFSSQLRDDELSLLQFSGGSVFAAATPEEQPGRRGLAGRASRILGLYATAAPGAEESASHAFSPQLDLSIVIPAYKEALRITPYLEEIVRYMDAKGRLYEVLVVDDGSTDGTSEVVREITKAHPQVQLITLPVNQGKGCAVRTGVLASRGERILFTDADGSTPIAEIERLGESLDEGKTFAIGSRAMRSQDTEVEARWYRRILGRSFNKVLNFLLLPGIADTQCGFKMFTAPTAKFLFHHQRENRFSFDVEILYLARRAGIAVSEVPVNWHHVDGSKVNLVLEPLKMLRDLAIFAWRHRKMSRELFCKFVESRDCETV